MSLFRRLVCAPWPEESLSATLEMDLLLIFVTSVGGVHRYGSETRAQHLVNGEGLKQSWMVLSWSCC